MLCYFVLIVYQIQYILSRGPLLLIYSRGVGLQGKYPIWYYNIFFVALRCTPTSVVHRTP